MSALLVGLFVTLLGLNLFVLRATSVGTLTERGEKVIASLTAVLAVALLIVAMSLVGGTEMEG